jgi:putative ABC transport system substrate-binding protein
MKHSLLWVFVLLIFSVGRPVEAQQRPKMHRVGYVSGTGSSSNQGPYVEALREGLKSLGYVEGKNLSIEYRGAEGYNERVPGIVGELLKLNLDALVLPIRPAILAAKQASRTIPIIMVSNLDPVATGLVDSLARPGGNITGLTTLSADLNGKRLETLKDSVPGLFRVGVLRDGDSQNSDAGFAGYEAAAKTLNLQLHSWEVRGANPDFHAVFANAARDRINALITITNANLLRNQKTIVELALKNRLASMFEGHTWVEAGGLMCYSTDDLAIFRRAAVYVDKVLKGMKPGDIPIERPTKFEFVMNLKTAKQIGVTIPDHVLARVDRVIK